jgi:oxalate decarboxylase
MPVYCGWLKTYLPSVPLLQYVEEFSKVPWQEFPGGRYKASTNSTLTSTTIAGALFDLKPGGVRELHWHNVPEWAVVIKGTCM